MLSYLTIYMSARIIFRPRITKNHVVFLCPARALDCCRFMEKIREIKKYFQKETSLFQEIKKHFPSYVFLLVFFVALINFSRNLFRFFYFVALIDFSKNRFNFDFSSMLFFPSSLIRFWMCSDLKQRNKV